MSKKLLNINPEEQTRHKPRPNYMWVLIAIAIGILLGVGIVWLGE